MLRTGILTVRIFMDLYAPVSGRQFGKMVGQTEGAVRKAKARYSIVEGITPDGKYIPIVAANEWGKEILPEYLNGTVQNLKPKQEKPKPVKKEKHVNVIPAIVEIQKVVKIESPIKTIKPPKAKKQKHDPETVEEIVDEIMHEKLPNADADDLSDESVSEELDDRILKPEAERITAVLKAKILQITYQEKQKQLVPIEKVNSVFFNYGVEIRNTFESLPNQVIDKIRACDSRHEALRVLNTAIFDALNILSDIGGRPL